MKGKERMAKAMRLGEPDRVPVMCQLSLGHYFLNCDIPEIEIWHSTEAFGEALIEMQSRYQFDGILINLPGRDPNWQSYIRCIEALGEEKIIHWKNGWHTACPRDDNPHVYRENGERFFATFEEIEPERLFYVEPHDIGGVTYPYDLGFTSEIQERGFPPWQFDTIDYVMSRAGGYLSVHSEIFSPFTQFLELLDYTNGLLALMDDPVKSEDCLAALAEGAIALGRGQAERGVDAILISSAFAGAGFISPDHYRRFVLPFERMVIEGIKAEQDIPIYTHTCGTIGDRMEMMEQTGAQGLDTLDPPPLGNVELADAKRRIGSRMFIKGNIDGVNVILHGSPEQVFEEAKRCIETAAPEGGYILSSACSIPPRAPAANILSLIAAAERFGYYENYEAAPARTDSK